MITSKAIGALSLCGLLGVLATALSGCKNTERKVAVGGELQAHNYSLLDISKTFVTTATAGSGTVPQSPLMIRGGAMTFRSSSSTVLLGLDGNYPCFQIGNSSPSVLQLMNVAEEPSAGAPTVFLPNSYLLLTGNWTVYLYARNPDGSTGNPSSGVSVGPTNNCTVNGNTSSGVTLTPWPLPSASSFYGENPRLNESSPATHNQRFKNITAGCTGGGDQDSCEHLGVIQAGTYKFRCLDGECAVGIGPPS